MNAVAHPITILNVRFLQNLNMCYIIPCAKAAVNGGASENCFSCKQTRQRLIYPRILPQNDEWKQGCILPTVNAPGQRAFSHCAAPFSLEIRQYSYEKMACPARKILAAGHIASWKNTPSKCRSKKNSCKISKIMLDKWRTRVYNSQHKATASLSNGAQRRLFLFL